HCLKAIAAAEGPTGTFEHPLGPTYTDIANAWIAAVKAEKRERSTYEKYEQHLGRHIAPCPVALAGRHPRPFGEYRARELTTPLIYSLKTSLANPEAKRSIEMLRRLMAEVRMALKHGQIAGDLREN